jgi:hypothetical protein
VALKEDHPDLGTRTCEDCRTWVYGKDGSRVKLDDGEWERRRLPPECEDCPKSGVEDMTVANLGTWMKFITCRALGCLPGPGSFDEQDPVVAAKFEALALYYHQRGQVRDRVMGGLNG